MHGLYIEVEGATEIMRKTGKRSWLPCTDESPGCFGHGSAMFGHLRVFLYCLFYLKHISIEENEIYEFLKILRKERGNSFPFFRAVMEGSDNFF